MTAKVSIDGSKLTGRYRVECICGEKWGGRGEVNGLSSWSPALAIAECVAHRTLAHMTEELELRFTYDFSAWLLQYWEVATLNQATEIAVGR